MTRITLTELRGEYQRLWDSCQILPEWEKRIDEAVEKIKANRGRYEAIVLGRCPWYFIGAIHNMESSLSFSKHLHNGDPLCRRTVQVPVGRPVEAPSRGWDEGYTWEESAVDALKLQEIDRVRDWSIPGLLFQSERYNGWGYRLYYPAILSPYLWSGTNHYSKGKYASDGRFDRNITSEQVGVVPLFKKLMEETEPPVLQIAKAQDNKPLLKGGACKLRTEQDTWFTQAPIDVEQLDESDRVLLPAKSIIPVLAWRETQNNYLVITFGATFEGRNTWHVKASDVRMSVPTFIKPSTTPAQKAQVIQDYKQDYKLVFTMRLARSSSLLVGSLKLFYPNGEVIDYLATSGCRGWQHPEAQWAIARGPLPARSDYSIPTTPYWLGVTGVEGWFFHIKPDPVISPRGIKRGEFGVHFDANAPGSAGCIVLRNREGFKEFCDRLKKIADSGVKRIDLEVIYE